MLKVIRETKQISIESLAQRLKDGEKLIVFYRSGNERTGIPCFLHENHDTSYGFISPIVDYQPGYTNKTLKHCLEEASKARTLYVLTKEEAGQLFKIDLTNE